MSAIQVASNVLCAPGASLLGEIPAWESCEYGDALDGAALCRLVVRRETPGVELLVRSRVLRLLEATMADTATPGVLEYRIKKIEDQATSPTVTVEAVPILHDLADVRVSLSLGGVPTYALSFALLTPAQVVANYILTSLAAKGITWVEAGTITPTLPLTKTWSMQTCLWLAREIARGTDYEVRLRRDGDTRYLLDITSVNAAAPQPVSLIGPGGNVTALSRVADGYPQATGIIPQGAVPDGGTAATDAGEYAARVVSTGAGTIVVEDPEGNEGPIYWEDQHAGLYLEKLIPHKWIWPEDLGPGSTQYDSTLTPRDQCYVSSTGLIWVAEASGLVFVYDGVTHAFVARLVQPAAVRGIHYHAGTDQVFVAVSGSNTVRVYDATARTLTTTITVGNAPYYFAHATSVDRLYVTNYTDHTVSVINPNTNAVTATITGFATPAGAFDICYGSGCDRLFVTNLSDGNAYLVNPNTNTISNTLNNLTVSYGVTYDPTQGTQGYFYVTRDSAGAVTIWDPSGTPAIVTSLTSITTPKFCYFDATAGQVIVAYDTNAFLILSGTSIVGVVFAAAALERVGPAIAAQGVVLYGVPSGHGYLGWYVPATAGLALRRPITASAVGTQTESVATVAPITAGDLVSYRTNLAGGWRSELINPVALATYGPLTRPLSRPDLRGERNYVLNPWTVFTDAQQAAFTDYERGTNGLPQLRYNSPDASAWTSYSAQADGNQSSGATDIFLKGMTPGDVIQVGDYFPTQARHAATRAVVDGAGKAQVRLFHTTLAAGLTNGDTVVIERSGVNLRQDLFYRDAWLAVPHGSGGTIGVGKHFPVPYIPGRSTVWATVEVAVWRYFGFVPNTDLKIELRSGATVLASATGGDTATYSDKALVVYTLSCQYTMTSTAMLSLWIRGLNASSTFTMYPVRFQLTLGPEAAITPGMEFMSHNGELYHVSQRALRDLADPVLQYECGVIEDDPDRPYVVGGRTVLQDTERARAANPRVVAIRRSLPMPTARGPGQRPIIELETRTPSLIRSLAAAGVL